MKMRRFSLSAHFAEIINPDYLFSFTYLLELRTFKLRCCGQLNLVFGRTFVHFDMEKKKEISNLMELGFEYLVSQSN